MKSISIFNFYEISPNINQEQYDDVLGYLTLNGVDVGLLPEDVTDARTCRSEGFNNTIHVKAYMDPKRGVYGEITPVPSNKMNYSANAFYRITDHEISEFYDR